MEGTPEKRSAGKAINPPPPATELTIPPPAAAKKSRMKCELTLYFIGTLQRVRGRAVRSSQFRSTASIAHFQNHDRYQQGQRNGVGKNDRHGPQAQTVNQPKHHAGR